MPMNYRISAFESSSYRRRTGFDTEGLLN